VPGGLIFRKYPWGMHKIV